LELLSLDKKKRKKTLPDDSLSLSLFEDGNDSVQFSSHLDKCLFVDEEDEVLEDLKLTTIISPSNLTTGFKDSAKVPSSNYGYKLQTSATKSVLSLMLKTPLQAHFENGDCLHNIFQTL
jgi:hypothetical protein